MLCVAQIPPFLYFLVEAALNSPNSSTPKVGAEMVTMSLPVEPSHRWSLPALQQRRNHFRRNAEPLMLEKLVP